MAADKPEEGWVEHVGVTGRPVDEPEPNTTFAVRAKARAKEAKAAKADDTVSKSPAKKAAKK